MADSIYELGAYQIADKNYQPIRTNNFKVMFDFSKLNLKKYTAAAGTTVGAGSKGSEVTIGGSDAQSDIAISVISFKPPHFSQDAITIKRNNSEIYFANTAKFSDNTLKINDFKGTDGKSIIEAWQACQYDIYNDSVSSSDKYKITATVIEYMPDGTAIRGWTLHGCWVKSIDEPEWNAEQSNKKDITATIVYDRAYPYVIS